MEERDLVTEFAQILADQGVLAAADIESTVDAFQGHTGYAQFEDFLLEEGIASKDQLLEALGTYYGRPAIDVMGELCNHHYVHMFSVNILAQYNFVPLRRDGDVMTFAAGNPDDAELERIVGEYVSYDPEFFPGIPRHIRLLARQCHDEALQEETTEGWPSIGAGEERTDEDPSKEDIVQDDWDRKNLS